MAISFVQYTDNSHSGGASTIVQSSSLNTTSGNFIVVVVSTYDGSGDNVLSGVTDTAGNTYTKAIGEYRSGITNHRSEIWYAENITGNSSNVVTGTFSGSTQYGNISVSEYSGVATSSSLDDTSYSTLSSASPSSGDATASEDGCLIIGGAPLSTSRDVTKGTGFVDLVSDTTNVYYYAEYKILGVAGDYDANFTLNSSTEIIVVAAIFKPAGSTPTPTVENSTFFGCNC